MLGELAALGTALFWAVGDLLLKPLSTRLHPLVLNLLRSACGALFFVAVVGATGGFDVLLRVPVQSAIIATAGTFAAVAVGDSLFVLSLRHIDISRASPIASCGFPLVTIAVGYFALHEHIAGVTLIGLLLVLAGIYLTVFHTGPLLIKLSFSHPQERRGLLLLVLTIIVWGLSVVFVKLGVAGLETSVANLLRFSGTAVLLTPLVLTNRASLRVNWRWQDISLAGLSGVFGLGIASIFFLFALNQIGAAMTSVLSSTTPLFLVPMAVVFFKERVTPRLLVGVCLSVLGICLVFLA